MSILSMLFFLIPLLGGMMLLLIVMELLIFLKLKKEGKILRKYKKRKNKEKQEGLKKILFYLVGLFLLLTGAFGGIHYIKNNQLMKEDKQIILESQNIVSDLEKELALLTIEEVEQADFEKTMIDIGSIMATKGLHQASDFYPENHQQVLNRYFRAIKELGILLSNDAKKLYDNPGLIEALQQDIEKVSQYEKKVNETYSIKIKTTSKGAGT